MPWLHALRNQPSERRSHSAGPAARVWETGIVAATREKASPRLTEVPTADSTQPPASWLLTLGSKGSLVQKTEKKEADLGTNGKILEASYGWRKSPAGKCSPHGTSLSATATLDTPPHPASQTLLRTFDTGAKSVSPLSASVCDTVAGLRVCRDGIGDPPANAGT